MPLRACFLMRGRCQPDVGGAPGTPGADDLPAFILECSIAIWCFAQGFRASRVSTSPAKTRCLANLEDPSDARANGQDSDRWQPV